MKRQSHQATERLKKIGSMSHDEAIAFMRSERPNDYGPWICKERPAGDWVVDQLDRTTMKVRRFGPYKTAAEARDVYAELTAPNHQSSEPEATTGAKPGPRLQIPVVRPMEQA